MTNMIHSFKNKANVSILKSSFCLRLFFLLSLLSIGNMHAYIKLTTTLLKTITGMNPS